MRIGLWLRIWNGLAVAYFIILTLLSPGDTEEYQQKYLKLWGYPTEIRTEYLQNTSLERYIYTNPQDLMLLGRI